jgi:hypothetical protein
MSSPWQFKSFMGGMSMGCYWCNPLANFYLFIHESIFGNV